MRNTLLLGMLGMHMDAAAWNAKREGRVERVVLEVVQGLAPLRRTAIGQRLPSASSPRFLAS